MQGDTRTASTWVVRLWAGLLFGLVLVWGVWGAYALVGPGPRARTKQADGNQAWFTKWRGWFKRQKPLYRKFTTFADAVDEAKKLKRPIFLDLYADWCVPCKKLEKETFKHPAVRPTLEKYLVVKFNVDLPEGKALARRFYVRYYPTTLMLDSSGREVERVIGFYPPRYYKPALVSVLERRGTYRQLLRRHRRNSRNLKLKLKLAKRSILRRYIAQAENLYQQVWRADPENKQGVGLEALFGVARSQARLGKYSKALKTLETFFQKFPATNDIHREARRLEIYAYKRRRRRREMAAAKRRFAREYPGQSDVYK